MKIFAYVLAFFVAVLCSGRFSIKELDSFCVSGVCVVADGEYFCCSLDKTEQLLENLTNIEAVQVYIEGATVEQIVEKLDVQVISCQSVEEIYIVCGYCKEYLRFSYFLQNKKCNIMIAETEDCIIVGVPIIVTGY